MFSSLTILEAETLTGMHSPSAAVKAYSRSYTTAAHFQRGRCGLPWNTEAGVKGHTFKSFSDMPNRREAALLTKVIWLFSSAVTRPLMLV